MPCTCFSQMCWTHSPEPPSVLVSWISRVSDDVEVSTESLGGSREIGRKMTLKIEHHSQHRNKSKGLGTLGKMGERVMGSRKRICGKGAMEIKANHWK